VPAWEGEGWQTELGMDYLAKTIHVPLHAAIGPCKLGLEVSFILRINLRLPNFETQHNAIPDDNTWVAPLSSPHIENDTSQHKFQKMNLPKAYSFRICAALLIAAMFSLSAPTLLAQGTVSQPKGTKPGKQPAKANEEETIYEISTNDELEIGDHRSFPKAPDPVLRTRAASRLAAVRLQYAAESRPDYLVWMRQGNPKGLAEIKEGLKSTDGSLNKETLKIFEVMQPDTALKFDDETFDLVMKFMQAEGECQYFAPKALAIVAPTRAAEPMMTFIQNREIGASTRYAAVSFLGYTTPNAKSIAFLGKLYKNKGRSENEDFREVALHSLAKMHLHGTTADRNQIEAILKPKLLNAPLNEDDPKSAIDELAQHPSAEMLPVFERYQHDEVVGEEAMYALAQLQGAAARPMVERLLTNQRTLGFGLYLISWTYKDAPDAAWPALQAAYTRFSGSPFPEMFLQGCWDAGGEPLARKFIARLTKAGDKTVCETYLREMLLPVDEQNPLWLKSQALHKAGFLPKPLTLAELESMRRADDERESFAFSQMLLRRLPGYADAYRFSKSHIRVHQEVLHCFLPALGDRLQGLECYQHRQRLDIDRYETSLWLIYNGTMYSPLEMPFQYSIFPGTIIQLLNAILQDAQIPERFVSINLHGYTHYMFMHPDRVAELTSIIDN
jgi:hypothetical protein